MNNNYDIIVRTIKHEGGYSNNPLDKGGETYCGISRIANPTWKGWFLLDKQKDKKLAYYTGFLYDEVVSFYSDKYFNAMELSRILNPNVRACVFDFCVNSGGAMKVVQSLLRTKYGIDIMPDGVFGRQTAQAINNIPNQTQLNNDIVDARKQYVQSLVQRGLLAGIFLNGILKRAESYRVNVVQSMIDEILNSVISVIKRIFTHNKV